MNHAVSSSDFNTVVVATKVNKTRQKRGVEKCEKLVSQKKI